ncbi:hypothetical protein VFPBJ_09010 [Purpureocillium lilacinum]|uniref:Uncharacterized protein n=1 Tax=Purpureocillium lilacinum TaxID=33203 RepID=A0A179GGS8_PURLI|nr:hypothetical protein VFPBJ_09010 [Purpureocillium lilacinum]
MDGTIRFGLGLGPAWALCAQSVHRRGQAPGSRSALSPWETLAYTSGDRKAAEMAWLCSIKIQLDRSVGRPLRVPAVDARHSVRRVLRYGRAGRAAQEKKPCDTQRSLRDPSWPKCKVTRLLAGSITEWFENGQDHGHAIVAVKLPGVVRRPGGSDPWWVRATRQVAIRAVIITCSGHEALNGNLGRAAWTSRLPTDLSRRLTRVNENRERRGTRGKDAETRRVMLSGSSSRLARASAETLRHGIVTSQPRGNAREHGRVAGELKHGKR